MEKDCPRCLQKGSLKLDPYKGMICCQAKSCGYIDNLRFQTMENETNNYDGDYEIQQQMRATQTQDNPFFQNNKIQFSGKNSDELNKELTEETKFEIQNKKNYFECLNNIDTWNKVFQMPDKLKQLSKFNFNVIYKQTKNQRISKLGWKCVSIVAINWAIKDEQLEHIYNIEKYLRLAKVEPKHYLKWNQEIKKQITGFREKFIEVSIKYSRMLQMNDEEKKAVRELAEQIESKELHEGQRSETIAAAIIFIICQLSNRVFLNLKTLKDISQISDIRETTIFKYYKSNLYPKRYEICPQFANCRNPDCLL